MKPILYSILICTLILACTRYPAGVEETLSQAGRNRGELKKVLRHYREHPEDSLKYQAACFLIDNMKWHLSTERTVFPDSSLFEWHTRFDSLYTNMMLRIPDSTLYSERNRERYWQFSYAARQVASVFPPDTPTIVKGTFPDPQNISSAFLISHIENAFHTWHTPPLCLLPHVRAIQGNDPSLSGRNRVSFLRKRAKAKRYVCQTPSQK